MDGVPLLLVIFAAASFWYGARVYAIAYRWSRAGVLTVPALVIGAAELWGGGAMALAAGSLARQPPALPDRAALIGWSILVCALVLVPVLNRRPDVEARLPEPTRRALDGRFVLLGAVVTAVGMAVYAVM